MDGVAHIGGLPEDDEWECIYQSNIAGTYNVFEACRRVGVLSRYPRGPTLTVDIVPTPVGFYTISKVFGESIAYSYAREYDMGCVCVCIGSLNLPETSLLNLSPSKPQRLPVGLQSGLLTPLWLSSASRAATGHSTIWNMAARQSGTARRIGR